MQNIIFLSGFHLKWFMPLGKRLKSGRVYYGRLCDRIYNDSTKS